MAGAAGGSDNFLGLGSIGGGLGGLGGFNKGMAEGMGALSTYEAHMPEIDRQNFMAAIKQSQENSQNVYGQQQALAQQLIGQTQGQGPNPALEQLKQTTGQNQMQNTGMIASQKGVNPAMAARMASQNAGNMGQQAAGQAATMRAQQQLGAQGQLGGLYGQMGNQGLSQQQILQGAQAAQNNAITSGANATQQINAHTAEQNAIQRGLISGSNMNNIGSFMGSQGAFGGGGGGGMPMMGAKGGQVPKLGGGGFAPETIGAPDYAKDNSSSGGGGGGGSSSMMSMLPLLMMAASKGGQVPKMADGGSSGQGFQFHINTIGMPAQVASSSKKKNDDGSTASDEQDPNASIGSGGSSGTTAAQDPSPATMMPAFDYEGGEINKINKYASGGSSRHPQSFAAQYMKNGMNMKQGGHVPGTPKVKGDSLKNDTQPALLSPGEIVIPNHITQADDAPEKAAQFVQAILSRKGKKK